MTPRLWLSVVACWLVGSVASAADGLQAGAAKTDITPPVGFAMWGYGARHDAPSLGVHDALQARALVLTVGQESIALVGLDLGRAPTRQSMATIRKRVKEAVGVEHLFLVGSHTHHGPVIELDNWPSAEKSYVRELEQKLADVIVAAAKARKPARFGVASKEVPFNRNRHTKRPEKPVDSELLVLRVEDLDGKPIAHAVNFAAHPTMTDARLREFSADYPGYLTGLVEKETGAPCLFLQGAAGDLSANAGEHRGPELFGHALAREVLGLVSNLRCTAGSATTLQAREDDFQFKSRVDLGNPGVKAGFVAGFFKGIVDFYEQEYRDGVRPHLTTALLDGRIGFVGVSGEFFCSHSLELKRRARLDHVFFLGYCNDYQQYFPTIEAASEGGYGADPIVDSAEVGAGERMMNQALVNLYKMRDKLPNLPPDKSR
jgi:neutral ceramidase